MPIMRVLIALLLCAGAGWAGDLRLLNQDEPIKGELVSIDDKEVVFKTADGMTLRKPLMQLLQVDFQTLPPQLSSAYHQVELTDGSILNCKTDGFNLNGKTVELTVLPDMKLAVPLKALSYFLKDAHDPRSREHADWKTILRSRRNQDMLAREYQTRLNGIEGTFIDGKGMSINFLLQGRTEAVAIDLKSPAVKGCVFVNKPDPQAPPAVCKVLDMHHNLIKVAKLETKDGGELVVTTVSGAQLKLKRDLVARLDYSQGKVTFLSDLEPNVLQELPEDHFERGYVKDKNRGGPLQLAGQRYAKGLFVHVATRLSFKISGEYNEFIAQVGVDETVPGKTHVRLVVLGDGKEIFTGEFKRADRRRELKLSVRDVQELTIAVEPVDPLNLFGQHLDLADAKLSK
jgi:hypothetical protein